MTTTLTGPEASATVVEQTRLRALALQLEFVLRQTTDLEWWLPQMAHGLENRWVTSISVYGLEWDWRARALLRLDIDWDSHEAERGAGRFLVTFAKAKHPPGASNLVTATAGWFRAVVVDRQLETECRIGLSDEVHHDGKLRARAYKELSLQRDARPIRWVAGPREDILEGSDPELPELTITCTVVY